MSTLVSSQAEIIRRRLQPGGLSRYNFCSGAVTATATSVTLTDDVTGVVAGSTLGIDSELLLVRPTVAGMVVPVYRGFRGTTAATHASGALVEVAPRFPLADIVDTMREEVDSWGQEVFSVVTAAITPSTALRAYNLPNAVNPWFVLEVVQENAGQGTGENSRTPLPFVLLREQDTTDFPSGVAVQLKTAPGSTDALRVTWAEPFDTDNWATTTDLEDDVGLTRGLLSVVTYGTMWRLMSGREVPRTDLHASGETRRAEENPPGFSAKTAGELLRLRDRVLAAESVKLRSRYSYRWL